MISKPCLNYNLKRSPFFLLMFGVKLNYRDFTFIRLNTPRESPNIFWSVCINDVFSQT